MFRSSKKKDLVGGGSGNEGSIVPMDSLSLSSRSFSDGSRNSSIDTTSSNAMGKDLSSTVANYLPPVILTRSIPDGDDDKYACKSYAYFWKKSCGCFNDQSPRPVNQNCHRFSDNNSASASSQSNAFQKQFIVFVSLLAFVRITNTFYTYKTSLDQMLQGYEPMSTSYDARHLSTIMTTNTMMFYQQIFEPFDVKSSDSQPYKKRKPPVTYDRLVDEYNIPLLVVPQYDVSVAMQREGFDPWRLTNDDEAHTRVRTIQETYRAERQQRTRPPSIAGMSEDSDSQWTVVETFSTTERLNVGKATSIDIAPSGNATTNDQYNWKALCSQANLSKASSVVITNALSVSIGSPLTLLLSKQCGVKSIMIVDSMFPNTKRRRLVMMDTFRTLYRNVLTLKFTNPTNTAGLGKVGSESPTDWLEAFAPTHIIHLEDLDSTLDSDNQWGEYMSSKGQQLLHLQSSMLPIQQIMNYVHHKETSNKMNILHVSLSSILSDPVTADDADDENTNNYGVEHLHRTSVTHDVNAMMADYLHTMQQFHTSMIDESNMLQMHHLKLPNVYGPIINGKLNDRTKVIHESGNSLYLDDAMLGIFKALHISQEENRQIMTIPAEQVRATNSAWRQDLTHAYEIELEYPFGGIEPEHYLSKVTSLDRKAYNEAMTWVNDLYGVEKARFPCASSCVDHTDTTTCDASVWDSVYPVSQSVTNKCTHVMYYVNLDPALESLAGPTDVTSISDDICRIAFIAGSSTLAIESLLQGREAKNEKKLSDAQALNEYNGKLTMNGWTLVWIPDMTATVSERDRSLIRIDPSRFFSYAVRKAMYVESVDIMTLSNDDIMETILSQTVHEEHTETYHTTELREGFDDLYRSIEHPPSLARSVTFLARELPSNVCPSNPAQFINLLVERGVPNVKGRHLNYYKQMNHYIQVDMNRPVEDSDGSSPFVWISRDYFVHDLTTEMAHMFRCQWYDAHLYWGPESIVADSEELSLAYILAKQRVEGRIGLPLLDDMSWFPQLNPFTEEPIYVDPKTMTTEAFVRVMAGEIVAEEEEESSDNEEGAVVPATSNEGESSSTKP